MGSLFHERKLSEGEGASRIERVARHMEVAEQGASLPGRAM